LIHGFIQICGFLKLFFNLKNNIRSRHFLSAFFKPKEKRTEALAVFCSFFIFNPGVFELENHEAKSI